MTRISGLLETAALFSRAWLPVLVVAFGTGCTTGSEVPMPGSDAYLEVVTGFYGAVARIQVGEDRNAAAVLSRVASQASGEPAVWYNLGLVQARQGDLNEAARSLEEALEWAPQNSRVLQLAGSIERLRERPETARHLLREAARYDSTNVRPLFELYLMERETETQGTEEGAALLRRILEIAPTNLAAIVEAALLSAERHTTGELEKLADRLAEVMPPAAPDSVLLEREMEVLRRAVIEGDFALASNSLLRIQNVLKQTPEYREARTALEAAPAEIADPMTRFVRVETPSGRPAPPDTLLTFNVHIIDVDETRWVGATFLSAEGPMALIALHDDSVLIDPGRNIPFPASGQTGLNYRDPVAALDYDYDFQVDLALAGPEGFRLFRQGADGTFTNVTSQLGLGRDVTQAAYSGVWAVDIDLEGDMDLVLSRVEDRAVVLRNNGDGTFTRWHSLGGAAGIRDFVWADLDGDGDPDPVFLDRQGMVDIYLNERSGRFRRHETEDRLDTFQSIAVADIDRDGVFDLITLDTEGVVRSHEFQGSSAARQATVLFDSGISEGRGENDFARIIVADLDNNGSEDAAISSGFRSSIWLQDAEGSFRRLDAYDDLRLFTAADLRATGNLDLLGLKTDGKPAQVVNRADNGYLSRSILPRAAESLGDRRINSFGIGGEIELRTGLLYQKRLITGPIIHFGLGDHVLVDVARIIWPNGTSQAQFDLESDQTLIARQSLKGSCPWVFANDGEEIRFVTDFLWRSPLGLKINSQETADIMTTADWVRIPGDMLADVEGEYDIRITAELWETHFIDHVSLIVVDRPNGTETLVNELFAHPPPELAVHQTGPLVPVSHAVDHSGNDVTAVVRKRDGDYLASFDVATHQGLTEHHYVEVDLSGTEDVDNLTLVGSGWVYPTDSSINVAISQGDHPVPTALQLEVPDSTGSWITVRTGIGFPAGKMKTVLIGLEDVFQPLAPRKVRLSTNLEIYWDAFWWTSRLSEPTLVMNRLDAGAAELRYRGFSVAGSPDRSIPETPEYDQLETIRQKWLDLEGYYTRFGDVTELLRTTDDRYVIMNAGDEIRLTFTALPGPPPGWKRDFVLAGDGWVKDGDYNTTASRTVLPLPTHSTADYTAGWVALQDDPVYRRHAEDWTQYHTRFVTPDRFVRALARYWPQQERRTSP